MLSHFRHRLQQYRRSHQVGARQMIASSRLRHWSRRCARASAGISCALVGILGLALALGGSPARAAFPGSDGRIVFSSNRVAMNGATNFTLYSISNDGTDLRRLTYDTYLPPGTPVESEEEECKKGGGTGEGSAVAGEAPAPAGSASEEARLTPIDNIEPAVSPDGRQIAFVSNRVGSGGAYDEIWMMSINGTDVRQLTSAASVKSGPKAAYEPAWSPDGKQIVYRRGEGAKADLWVIDIATGRQTKLQTAYEKGPAGYDAQPAWSPDGSRIAFVKGSGRAADIWIYDVYGPHQGESVPIIHAVNVTESSPSFSPDGKQLLYSRGDASAGAGIWIANADGSDQHPLSVPEANAEGKVYSDLVPKFSPSGHQIVFESTRNGVLNAPDTSTGEGECKDEEGEEIPAGAVDLFRMSATGADLTQLTTAASIEGPQDLSPDWQTLPSVPLPPVVPTQHELQAPVAEVPLVSSGSQRCVSLKSFTLTIHLSRLDRKHMRWARALINRQRVKLHVSGRTLKVRVSAAKAVKGQLTVEVYVMLRYGNHLSGRHTFTACHSKRGDGLRAFHLQRHGPGGSGRQS